MTQEFLDLLTAIDAAVTPDELKGLMERVVSAFGFGGYSYHKYRPSDGDIEYIGQWPSEWLKRYEDNHYVDIDPVTERLLRTVTPFTWREAVIGKPVNASERIVMNEARDFGITDGAEIPVHEPGFGLATFSVFSHNSTEFQEAWSRHGHEFHVFCLYFHEKYNQLEPSTEQTLEPQLTKRERECLVLTSRGKTAWEIGNILSISERTAKQHLTSAAKKLGSYSKHHAVVKAILTRLILP